MATSKTNQTPAEREVELAEAEAEARAKVAEIRSAMAAHRREIARLQREFDGRLNEHSEDFTESGATNPNTPAAEAEQKLDELRATDRFDRILAVAGSKHRAAEGALARHRRDYDREVLDALRPEAEAAVDAYVEWAEDFREIYENLSAVATRAKVIAVKSKHYDPLDIPEYNDLRAMAKSLASGKPMLPLPRLYVAEREQEERHLAEQVEGGDHIAD